MSCKPPAQTASLFLTVTAPHGGLVHAFDSVPSGKCSFALWLASASGTPARQSQILIVECNMVVKDDGTAHREASAMMKPANLVSGMKGPAFQNMKFWKPLGGNGSTMIN